VLRQNAIIHFFRAQEGECKELLRTFGRNLAAIFVNVTQ